MSSVPGFLCRVKAFVLDHSLLLPIGAVSALVWANLGPSSYGVLAHWLHFPVNEVGMAFFFGLAAKEIVEATLPGGPLASLRRAGLPLLAAVGGMVVPALLYVALCLGMDAPRLTRGWAIPCATDIAFSYLVVRFLLGARHPAIPFLLLLAIADDAIGLVVLAVAYPASEFKLVEFLLIGTTAMGLARLIRRRKVTTFWPYVATAGAVAWVALYRSGLHPSLALVPIVPFMPHAARIGRDLGLADPHEHHRNALSRFEEWWRAPVQWVLLFFGLANAGVPFESVGTGTWAVLIALLIDKPIGILVFSGISAAAGMRKPAGVGWADITVTGLAAGIGFTVSLFFAAAAFPEGPQLDQTKMGALLSFGAALLAASAASVLRVGRFGSRKPV